ncbi:MAG TPA: ATP-binding protein, partial [Acidimicrobiia bacterium]|nr:ATP-binding protein [Acidimicrobiia bacterium]
LSEGPHRKQPLQLLVDVGTNAEIVLGNSTRLLAASSPTGPAFEGAQISSGQRAAPGAIERVRIDRETLQPRFSVIGHDGWSDEPGFENVGVTGICGSGIIEAVAELFLAGVVDSDGALVDDGRTDRVVATGRTFAYRLSDAPLILITQADVRAIQLAKAALYAGVRLLMDQYGVEQVDQIRLAGAFGSHIDPLYAMVLGMIPDCPLEQVSAAGNAAGVGAMIALLSVNARVEIETVARKVEKVETAVEPRFQEHFVAAMAIPHKTAPYPELAKAVQLPTRLVRPEQGRRRRRPSNESSEGER